MKSGPKPLLLVKPAKKRIFKLNLENNLSQLLEKIEIEQLTRRFARLTICSDMDLERDEDNMDLEKVGPVISPSTSSLRFK